MSYAIIINKKEKLYHVERCCDADYWWNKNNLIQDVLRNYDFEVVPINHLLVDADKVKDSKVSFLQSEGYKEAFLDSKIQMLASKANDELRQKSRKKRR